MLSSTQEFISKVTSCISSGVGYRPTLVSFDVESLFTNVPLKEVIDIACNFVYESDEKPCYPKEQFETLLEYATSSIFM